MAAIKKRGTRGKWPDIRLSGDDMDIIPEFPDCSNLTGYFRFLLVLNDD